MSSLKTPPRIGPRVPLPPPPPSAPEEQSEPPVEGQPDELEAGDLLEGRYQIEERIGEGGVGFVYRALQLKLHRRVAVKLLQQDVIGEEELRPRFQQEALTLAALSHPHIVGINDYGVVRGRPFLVMELLEGRTLREIIDEEGPLAPLRALTLLRQVVLALAYAHSLGIVHRDLKPANMIVQLLPAYEHLKVLDFGMVKLLPGSYLDRGEQLTRVGFTFGTPAYMSPEHAMGGDVDGRSDLYSVGVLLFELLTGSKPFDGEIQDILRDHLTAPVPRLAALRPELAAFVELQEIVDRAMAKEPNERFESATELLRVFDELLMSGLLADPLDGEEEPSEDEDEGRASLGPKVRDALESAAAALNGYARVSREVWRDKASPQLVRANRELRALAARLAPRLRGLSEAAWAELRPRLAQAAARISRLALDARQRLEASMQPRPPALPADPRPLDDRTVVDAPRFDPEGAELGVAPPAEPTIPTVAPTAFAGAAPAAANDVATARTVAAGAMRAAEPDAPAERADAVPPVRGAAESAEPLVLEPRERSSNKS